MKNGFLHQFLMVGLMAMVFIVGGKAIFTRYNVPGVSDLFKSA